MRRSHLTTGVMAATLATLIVALLVLGPVPDAAAPGDGAPTLAARQTQQLGTPGARPAQSGPNLDVLGEVQRRPDLSVLGAITTVPLPTVPLPTVPLTAVPATAVPATAAPTTAAPTTSGPPTSIEAAIGSPASGSVPEAAPPHPQPLPKPDLSAGSIEAATCPRSETLPLLVAFDQPALAGLGQPDQGPAVPLPIPCGRFTASLISSDQGHSDGASSQPHEQWKLVFVDRAGEPVAESQPTQDLADDETVGITHFDVDVPVGAVGVRPVHAGSLDTPDTVDAVGVVFSDPDSPCPLPVVAADESEAALATLCGEIVLFTISGSGTDVPILVRAHRDAANGGGHS